MQSIRREKTKTAPKRVLFLFWLGYRDSDSRGTKPLGRRGSDSLVKGCHSLPLRSNPDFMRGKQKQHPEGAVLFCIAPPKKISAENPYDIRGFGIF